MPMRLYTTTTIRVLWEKYPEAKTSLHYWIKKVKIADWESPTDVQKSFKRASFVQTKKDVVDGNNKRVIFNIKGNNFRLVCHITFERKSLFVK